MVTKIVEKIRDLKLQYRVLLGRETSLELKVHTSLELKVHTSLELKVHTNFLSTLMEVIQIVVFLERDTLADETWRKAGHDWMSYWVE